MRTEADIHRAHDLLEALERANRKGQLRVVPDLLIAVTAMKHLCCWILEHSNDTFPEWRRVIETELDAAGIDYPRASDPLRADNPTREGHTLH